MSACIHPIPGQLRRNRMGCIPLRLSQQDTHRLISPLLSRIQNMTLQIVYPRDLEIALTLTDDQIPLNS